MGIPCGITVITGGGYSGKSTLLDALEFFFLQSIFEAVDFLLIFLAVEELLFFDGIIFNQILIVDCIFKKEGLITKHQLLALV